MSQPTDDSANATQLRHQVAYLEADVVELRRRLHDAPGGSRALDQRLLDTQRSLAAVTSQNERLAQTLREARDQIVTLKEEVRGMLENRPGLSDAETDS